VEDSKEHNKYKNLCWVVKGKRKKKKNVDVSIVCRALRRVLSGCRCANKAASPIINACRRWLAISWLRSWLCRSPPTDMKTDGWIGCLAFLSHSSATHQHLPESRTTYHQDNNQILFIFILLFPFGYCHCFEEHISSNGFHNGHHYVYLYNCTEESIPYDCYTVDICTDCNLRIAIDYDFSYFRYKVFDFFFFFCGDIGTIGCGLISGYPERERLVVRDLATLSLSLPSYYIPTHLF
jgi:hypothetical protein